MDNNDNFNGILFLGSTLHHEEIGHGLRILKGFKQQSEKLDHIDYQKFDNEPEDEEIIRNTEYDNSDAKIGILELIKFLTRAK